MSFQLDIVSLNIECNRNFDRFLPFLKKQKPEIVLLQEVLDKDISYIEEALGMQSSFAPIARWCRDDIDCKLGMATFSSLPIVNMKTEYYRGRHDNLPIIRPGEAEKIPRALLITEIVKEKEKDKKKESFCFINTHFTWTPDGKPNEQQYQDLEILLHLLQGIPDFVLCGDFNAPRGMIVFDTLAAKYKDNIPLHITTTIDKNLHRAGDLNLVVDGLFTTPGYHVESVEIVDGLSDHCAIIAKVVTG